MNYSSQNQTKNVPKPIQIQFKNNSKMGCQDIYLRIRLRLKYNSEYKNNEFYYVT